MTPLVFYRSAAGSEPVREWLKDLSREDRHMVGYDLMQAQYGWPVGMPLCRAMGAGLHEIRTDLPGNRTARVLVCHHDGRLFALHAFIKKTRTTPASELKLAARRKQEVDDG